tara:strand:+ start:11045 stop:12520 length:1476 start_codon:yes stop_codon:yes gene_type:complete
MKNEKKHIDRLFQEGLKNFEATPNPYVWENISEQLLTNKKQRKVIPLWIKFSAIAAGLLLLFTLGNNLFFQDNNSTQKVNETIVDTEPQNKQDANELDNSLGSNTIDSNNNTNKENLANEDSKLKEANDSSKGVRIGSKNTNINKNEPIVAKNNSKSTLNDSKLNTSIKKELTDELTKQEPNNTVTSNSKKNNTDESQKNSIREELLKATDINTAVAKKNEISNIKKTSIEDAIAKNNKAKEAEDDLDVGDEVTNRWSVAPNIAPVYFNTLGEGSSIHNQFVSNTKTGNINISYGISTSYAVNNKLQIRAGIHKVTLGYRTNEVIAFNNIQARSGNNSYGNIKFNNTSNDVSFLSVSQMETTSMSRFLLDSPTTSISQELDLLEIPLEIQYKITNTKLGINAIGGFSALFLNSNEIYSTVDGNSTLIGKATNINNLSYSANLGFGFNYKLSNKLNLNLEPMFKYQLNTFRNTSGNFKPYFIGVYSGLSFKF